MYLLLYYKKLFLESGSTGLYSVQEIFFCCSKAHSAIAAKLARLRRTQTLAAMAALFR
jgi:hypothetical protein